jgi:hypothetical protein
MTGRSVRRKSGLLSDVQWRHRSPSFRALDHRFAVRTTDPVLGGVIDRIYGLCATTEEPVTSYSIVHTPAPNWVLFIDDERTVGASNPAWILQYITWHVNRQVIGKNESRLLLHAGVVARGGSALVLPATSGSGKTTLVAGLVRSGFAYMSDEVTAIDPESLLIEPYPKPLSIKPGGRSILRDLAPRPDGAEAVYHADQWYVNPAEIRPHTPPTGVVPELIVFPRYDPSSTALIEPVRKADALLELLRHTFALESAPRRNVETLARALRQVACYRLVASRLEEACAIVGGLAERGVGDQRDGGE